MPLTNGMPVRLAATLMVAIWEHYTSCMTRALSHATREGDDDPIGRWIENGAEDAYQLLKLDNPSLDVVVDLHEQALDEAAR